MVYNYPKQLILIPNFAQVIYSAIQYNNNGILGSIFGNWFYKSTYLNLSGWLTGQNSYYNYKKNGISVNFTYDDSNYLSSSIRSGGLSKAYAFNPGN